MLRRVFGSACTPWLVGVAGTVMSGLLAFVVWKHDERSLHERSQLAALSIKNELVHQVGSRVESLRYIADLWHEHGQPSRKDFEERVRFYGGPYSGYFLINWLDPSSTIAWTGPDSIEGQKVIGKKMIDADSARREPWLLSRDLREVRLSRVIDLYLGGRGILVYVPIYDGDQFFGHIQGVFRVKELLDRLFPEEKNTDNSFAVMVEDEPIYHHGNFDHVRAQTEATASFDLYGTRWTVRAGRSPITFFGQMGEMLLPTIFCFGFLLTLLLARNLHLLIKTRAQSRLLAEAHDSLRSLNESLEERVARRTSELSESRARLQKLTEELKTSNAELEKFTSIASHDLKEPLRAIGGHIFLINRNLKGKIDEETARYFEFVTSGVTRMRTLIDALLNYAQFGKDARKLRLVDCEAVVRDALSNLETSIRECGAEIEVKALPKVFADPTELLQLFQNLIANALKYRRKTPKIEISAEQKDGGWVFAVRDNGIGFPMEFKDRIFESFRRLHGPTEFAGAGLGLSVCQNIVERHGGRIWAESREGVGSTFSFTIPGPNLGVSGGEIEEALSNHSA